MKSGDCETCGKWDSSLIIGMCPQCTNKYYLPVKEMKALEAEISAEKGKDNDPLLQC